MKHSGYKVGQFNVQMIPQEIRDLMAEVAKNHPDLMPVPQQKKNFEEIFEEVAAYCNILIQGRYKVTDLALHLLNALRIKGASSKSSIILLH